MGCPNKQCSSHGLPTNDQCYECGKIDNEAQKPDDVLSKSTDGLSGQLEAACKLIGTIADCPFCFFGWETNECSEACNKFERGEGWECWKEYLSKQAI